MTFSVKTVLTPPPLCIEHSAIIRSQNTFSTSKHHTAINKKHITNNAQASKEDASDCGERERKTGIETQKHTDRDADRDADRDRDGLLTNAWIHMS